MYGWLNYQIEHHLWPDLPLSQYQKLQPQVKALCERHGIPYCQDSVFKRLLKAVDIMVGKTSMLKPAMTQSLNFKSRGLRCCHAEAWPRWR